MGDKKKRVMVNEVTTRPPELVSKKGTTGKQVRLQANYFKLVSHTDWCLFQYAVEIAPEEERTIIRKALVRTHKERLGAYLYDGTSMYTNQRLPQPLELQSIRNEDRTPINIKIKLVGDLVKGDYHYFQFFNIIVRKCLEHLNLQLVGRNYFDAAARVVIEQYRLELWPGYLTSIRQHESGILMCAEITHKVMRNQTLFDILTDIYNRDRDNYQANFRNTVIGTVVLTDYNNRTYHIDDVDFTSSPAKTFEKKDGTKISYAQYYRERYNITIRDRNQPLLASKSRDRDRRAGQSEIIFLIPELCRSTGITDDMRNNFHLMSALSKHTKLAPAARIAKLHNFNTRLSSQPNIVEEFSKWNFRLDNQLVQLPGRVLDSEYIIFGRQKSIMPKNVDWNFPLQESTPLSVGHLKDWILIYPNRLQDQTKNFLRTMMSVATRMNFNINPPQLQGIPDDRANTYANVLKDLTKTKNPQLICCVVSNNQQQRYSVIKKKLCVDRAVPSQVILARTLTQKSESMMKSVSAKVVIQLNCKIGGIPWTVKLGAHLPGLMVVGFDVCHDKSGTDFGAIVASLDQNYGRYFSAVSAHKSGEELSNNMAVHLRRGLEIFRAHNANRYPKQIVIYRDGVGEGQIPFVIDIEVNTIRKMLTNLYGGEHFQLAFIIVTKRINTRIFFNNLNPSPGTIVDDVITDPLKHDFFIVSQSVREGTVAPTAYNVIFNNTEIAVDKIQIMTFKLCHMYFNIGSTVRVPAPCQYAHKLAFFVSQALRQAPHSKLETLLYFL